MAKDSRYVKGVVVIAIAILVLVTSLVLSGFLKDDGPGEDSVQASSLNLPSYAYSNPMTLKAYEYTTLNPGLIEQVPCYCECFRMGHKSLKNCFITEEGSYDRHGSGCDICVGEVIKIKKMYEDGKSIEEIREEIDKEYSQYGEPTNTPLKGENYTVSSVNPTDYSDLSLTEEFDSLSDGLKMTPYGVNWARFIDLKQISGTPLEQYASDMVRSEVFYGYPLVGMYSGDYSATSWIEFHDTGKENINVIPREGNGMSNIVTSRPFAYGQSGNIERVAEHLEEMKIEESSYPPYKPVLEVVDDEDASLASVKRDVSAFSDITYTAFRTVENGKVEMVKAYHITDAGSIPQYIYDSEQTASSRGFDKYEVMLEDDVLEIRMVADLTTLLNEKV